MSESHERVPLGKAAIVGGVIVVLAITFMIVCKVAGATESWAGFTLLTYWGMADKLDMRALPRVVAGSLTGIGMAACFALLPPVLGIAGLVIAVVVLIMAIIASVAGRLPLLINMPAMLFVTLLTMPHLHAVSLPQVVLSLLLGALFWGGIGWALAGTAKRKASAQHLT